jgi:hypothetical protein
VIAVNLPMHQYGFVRRSFLSNHERFGFEPAVWFGLTCPANRAFGLTVLLQCGGLYRELPPHAFAFSETSPAGTIEQSQAWDCFGGDVQAIEYAYLRELPVTLVSNKARGQYLFSVEFADNGFSRYPAQSKTLHALRLDDGRLTFQPGNFFTVYDSSFTDLHGDCSWLRRQTEAWGVEDYPEVTR